MKGYNCTIFAYGQTGSGKTYTMMGDLDDPEQRGLTPRIVQDLFETILKASLDLEFTVQCSFMEIYMEKVKDLLNPVETNLPINEDKLRGVYVKGLMHVFVASVEEVFDIMQRGQSNRAVSSTLMNEQSSRSHSIFVLQVTQKNLIDGSTKVSKLSLVDLAGSEKIKKTEATGQTLEEAKKINKSLSCLGMVINALAEKAMHVPYRDSKLTRILQEAIGGNSRTTLIVNCSPLRYNEPETISSLRFGIRAKNIKNKPKINTEESVEELKLQLKKSKQQLHGLETLVNNLRLELEQWRSGQSVREEDQVLVKNNSLDDLASVITLTDDAFLERENELLDLLASKEQEMESCQSRSLELEQQLEILKEKHSNYETENKLLHSQVTDLQLDLEKQVFALKDMAMSVDVLQEEKTMLLERLEQENQTEKQKQAKIEQMMQQLHIEGNLKDQIAALSEEKQTLEQQTLQLKSQIDAQETKIKNLTLLNAQLEQNLTRVENEYQNLLEFKKQDTGMEKQEYYDSKIQSLEQNIGHLTLTIESKEWQLQEMIKTVEDLKTKNTLLTKKAESDAEKMHLKKKYEQQTLEFESYRQKMLNDLTNRCERVVHLEMQLDEAQSKYNDILLHTDSKVNQTKITQLESQLEHVGSMQKKLVDENSKLKKQVSLVDRKLEMRDERIQTLEKLFRNAQIELDEMAEKHKQETLQMQEKIQEQNKILQQQQGSWVRSSRISKPLRGGQAEAPEKKASWYVSLLKK
ncbi:P-loop containing nucleoside triphosphate hydrolase protein [Gorgonomyces haynaldii]|nr:P-loop containing nucleoside triphosphate hydrolase protein [Gorgonomyces haynaldii]